MLPLKSTLLMIAILTMLYLPACTLSDRQSPAPAPMTTSGGMEHNMDSMGSGLDHEMEPISAEGVSLAEEDKGGQPLEFRLEEGVKVFEITAKPVLWKILDDVTVSAYTYNGM